ncbi:MAG: cell division protein FtsQ/DivIB [Candidatus Omnitrophota bacterium]
MSKKIRKKRKSTPRKNDIKRFEFKKIPIKKILFALAIIALIAMTYFFFKNSNYFQVETIKIVDRKNTSNLIEGDLLKFYKGRNIFDINIKALALRLKAEYPAIKDVTIRRILPNKLEISVISRVPVAKIKSHGFFPIDNSGMVLPSQMETGELPVITGFSMWVTPRVGERLENKQLESAFSLLDSLKTSGFTLQYNVTSIDASNYQNLSFYLENGIEVKIGGEDFLKRIKKLRDTLENPEFNVDSIKYVDLRFNDVVIGPR